MEMNYICNNNCLESMEYSNLLIYTISQKWEHVCKPTMTNQ